jgi:hypothetical protein
MVDTVEIVSRDPSPMVTVSDIITFYIFPVKLGAKKNIKPKVEEKKEKISPNPKREQKKNRARTPF